MYLQRRTSPINVTESLSYILLKSETRAVRFWFGLSTLFFGLFMALYSANEYEYRFTLMLMHPLLWGVLFFINGLFLINGAVTSKYNLTRMVFESMLGSLLWSIVSVTSMMTQGSPGSITVASIMSMWLFVRYPVWNK